MKDFFRLHGFQLGFITLLIVFVAVKIPFFSLPYYWDEAWVYGPAIRTMESTGLGILPSVLPPELSRGHPLLFHFLSAGWMKLFGTSVTASHVFPLLVSVLLLIAVYVFGRKVFQSEKIGLIAAFVLTVQPIFLAQSGLLLPEMLLALFTVSTIYFYLENNRLFYFLTATLALFTKETAAVVVANLLFWTFLGALFSQEKTKWRGYFSNSFFVALPLVPFFIFFIIQKLTYGWFFFPEHISFIADSTTKMLNQLERYAAYLFIYQGRNILTFSSIIALIFVYFKGEKSSQKEKQASIVLLLQIFTGLLFCSLNFYSDRYVMFMVPLLILFFSYCIFKAFEFKWNSLAAIIIVGAVQYFHINQRSNCDHNLGYADAVKTHLQALDFLQHEKLQDKKIYASFLTLGYFQNPYEGYVSEGNRLRNMTGEFNDAAEYAIFSSREDEEFYNKLKQTGKLPTVFARFESHQAWSEIYKLKN